MFFLFFLNQWKKKRPALPTITPRVNEKRTTFRNGEKWKNATAIMSKWNSFCVLLLDYLLEIKLNIFSVILGRFLCWIFFLSVCFSKCTQKKKVFSLAVLSRCRRVVAIQLSFSFEFSEFANDRHWMHNPKAHRKSFSLQNCNGELTRNEQRCHSKRIKREKFAQLWRWSHCYCRHW